jgi:hypothetical protein
MAESQELTHQSAPDDEGPMNFDDCLNRGGHFWPPDAPGDHSAPCTLCGYDSGWSGRGEDGHDG